ncbi:MAG: methyltransferase [Kiritimatiellia bacterium]
MRPNFKRREETPVRKLTYAEQILTDALPDAVAKFPAEGRVLVAGNRSGRFVLELLKQTSLFVTAHAFDIHHAHAIAAQLAEGGERKGRIEQIVRCTPRVGGPYCRAFFMTTPRSMSAELVLDQLQDIYLNLDEGGEFWAAFEGDPDDALKTLRLVWRTVHVARKEKHAILFRAVKRGDPVKIRSFASDWEASVPHGNKIAFTSLPGCFCHRRPDMGGLSLAEVADDEIGRLAALPANGNGGTAPYSILDMGCGCGLVGLLAADAFRRFHPQRAFKLTLIDSHARAIAAAQLNAARIGVEPECILADDGLPRGRVGEYDLFVGNPPYYSEYRIAEVFLETAYRALKPGGVCLSVVKTATGLLPVQEKYFQTAEIIHRRGYCVLRSIRL